MGLTANDRGAASRPTSSAREYRIEHHRTAPICRSKGQTRAPLWSLRRFSHDLLSSAWGSTAARRFLRSLNTLTFPRLAVPIERKNVLEASKNNAAADTPSPPDAHNTHEKIKGNSTPFSPRGKRHTPSARSASPLGRPRSHTLRQSRRGRTSALAPVAHARFPSLAEPCLHTPPSKSHHPQDVTTSYIYNHNYMNSRITNHEQNVTSSKE